MHKRDLVSIYGDFFDLRNENTLTHRERGKLPHIAPRKAAFWLYPVAGTALWVANNKDNYVESHRFSCSNASACMARSNWWGPS